MSFFRAPSIFSSVSLRGRQWTVAVLFALGATACADTTSTGVDPEPTPLPPLDLLEGCQPLAADFDCTLPYPSDFFRRPTEDASGFEVVIDGEARIFTAEGFSATISDWRAADGFSALPTITFVLGPAVARGNLVSVFDAPTPTLAPGHGTVILNAETLEPVAHFVDFDGATEPGPRQAIQLRPLAPLEWNTRYIVGVTGLVDEDGATIDAPEGFRRLRDGQVGDDPDLVDLASRYESDVFAPLESFGVAQSALQLAWDFTTGDESFAVDDMFRMRTLVLAELEANPPVVNITGMLEDPPGQPNIWRTVYGSLTGPMVTQTQQPGAELARDDNGAVRLNGTATFDFIAKIPVSVRDSYAPGKTLLYGHGFFGTQDEVEGTSTRRLAQETGSMIVAIDWWGMSTADLGVVVSDIGNTLDATKALRFTERVPQGMANWLTLTHALQHQIPLEPEFQRPVDTALPGVVVDPNNAEQTNAGALIYDDTAIHFAGMSMGHILGGVMVALNADVQRAVFNVGGAGFTQMMSRAKPFQQFLAILDISVPDNLDQMKMASTMQRVFDRIDPFVFAPYLLQKEIPQGPQSGASTRHVLQQLGVADSSVPNFTSLIHTRAMGIPLVGPSDAVPFGIIPAESGAPSGLTIFDFGVDDGFYSVATPPQSANPVHDAVRNTPEALEQIRVFLDSGTVIHPCTGPCVLSLP